MATGHIYASFTGRQWEHWAIEAGKAVLGLSGALLRLAVFAQGFKTTAGSTAQVELSLCFGLF